MAPVSARFVAPSFARIRRGRLLVARRCGRCVARQVEPRSPRERFNLVGEPARTLALRVVGGVGEQRANGRPVYLAGGQQRLRLAAYRPLSSSSSPPLKNRTEVPALAAKT